jgi:hypothetical protein
MYGSAPHRAPLVDLMFRFSSGPSDRVDFGALVEIAGTGDGEGLAARLEEGSRRAARRYPKVTTVLDGRWWKPAGKQPSFQHEKVEAATRAATEKAFFDEPLSWSESLLRQKLLWMDEGPSCLMMRMHHALGDAISGLFYLEHQLDSWDGDASSADVIDARIETEDPVLRTHPRPAKHGPAAFENLPDPVWTPADRASGGPRRWLTEDLEEASLAELATRHRAGIEDVLLTLVLDTFLLWNDLSGSSGAPRMGLFVPINIRKRGNHGFGNGVGRVRMHARSGRETDFGERCRALQKQRIWSMMNGEWAWREPALARHLPAWMLHAVTQLTFLVPGIDRGSLICSHVSISSMLRWESRRPRIESVTVVPPLTSRYAVAVAAVTLRGRVRVTFAYDSNRLRPSEAEDMRHLLRQTLKFALQ